MKGLTECVYALRDPQYAAFEAKLIPNVPANRIVGVRAPELRRLAKSLSGREADLFMRELPHPTLEETTLHAYIVNDIREYGVCLAEVKRLLPEVDNWATCDSLAPRVFARHTEELLPEVRRWMASDHEYTVRFGIACLMRYCLGEAFRREQHEWVAAVRREEYYVRMMQAWYFATALAKRWDETLSMLDGRLPAWVHNKTIQKAVESYRISPEHKYTLRGLRVCTDRHAGSQAADGL